MRTETQARQLIRTTIALHQELEHRKHTTPPQKERIGTTPHSPRSRTPGGNLTDLSADLDTNLAELIRDLAHRIQPGRYLRAEAIPLLRWLSFNLQAAMEQDFIEDVLDEIEQQRKQLADVLQPAEAMHTNLQTFNTSQAVLQILAMHGHHHTREDLRNWHRRGCITRIKGDDGRYRFDAQQILDYLERG